ncbi:MAG: ABC transporter permease [Blastocatellia bacterium]|nr:ABC transporter permease [Blastocatellia bacterium]
MKKVLIIIKREYLTRVRTKAFVIGTVISPLLMLALIILPAFLATRGGGERQVRLIDQSGDPYLVEAIMKKVSPSSGDDRPTMRRNTRFVLSHRPVRPDEAIEEVREQYKDEVLKDSDNAYVVLPPGVLDGAEPEYYAKSTSDLAIRDLERIISASIIERRLARAGFDSDKVAGYMKPVDLKKNKITAEGESQEGGESAFIVGIIMLFFIYMTVLMYGISVMRGVIEEKQSRIVEVIVSSVRPTQMMLGKLIGIGLVGLTQYAVWVSSAVLLTVFGASLMTGVSNFDMPRLPVSLLIYFIIYFVLGYFLYATLYALVGSMVSSEEEAQQAQMPVTLLLVVPMLLFGMIMSNPNSPVATILSFIPFFAPTLMILRIAMVNPPLWQILLSMLIMVGTILGVVWVAARIYRVGILMYGKRPSIAELGRWLRYS